MSIIDCFGEDIDFPNGAPVTVFAGGTGYRSGYARCALLDAGGAGAFTRSLHFTPQTSFWVGCQAYPNSPYVTDTNQKFLSIFKSGTQSGLVVGSSSVSKQLGLYKFDGTTLTSLAAESGMSLGYGQIKLDIQIVNYGASATVRVYVNQIQVISYTGDVTVSGVTALDEICPSITSSSLQVLLSEFIISDSDTRPMSLVTLYPDAAGTTDDWPTGAYTDIDEVTINDSDLANTNTANQDEQFGLSDLPSGTFQILAVKVAARAVAPTGSTATKLAVGVRSGSTTDSGAAQTLDLGWFTYERIMPTNPVTGLPWTVADVNALQINLRSGS